MTADEVTRRWKLTPKGLELTEIQAGKRDGKKGVVLTVFKTAPEIIPINYDDQFVFQTGP